MIQDIMPHIFHNEYRDEAPGNDDFVLYFKGDEVLTYNGNFPKFEHLAVSCPKIYDAARYLFSVDEKRFYLVYPLAIEIPDGWQMKKLSIFRELEPRWEAFAGITGSQLYRFYHNRQYCGRCAFPMQVCKKERALICENCGLIEYPKLSPAVIVAVVDGERLLLSRYAGSPYVSYALLAGFAEVGETLEQTVHREVWEEVGVRVKNLRYYKSQPWAFTDSLLAGFFAELDGSNQITLQEEELAEAIWVSRGDIPCSSSDISLTNEMIEQFKKGLF